MALLHQEHWSHHPKQVAIRGEKEWLICCPSNSTVSEDAGIEPKTVAISALAVRRSNHSARSLTLRLDLIDGACANVFYVLP
jgi:hypothetical protein